MSTSPLNDAIRDVLAGFSADDRAASNKQVAEEVMTRHPEAVADRGSELVLHELMNRVRTLRKLPQAPSADTALQLTLPGFVKHLLSRLPAEIPRCSRADDAPDVNELPWGSLLRSSVGHVRIYRALLLAGIKADRARLDAVDELLAMVGNEASDDALIIDVIGRLVKAAE